MYQQLTPPDCPVETCIQAAYRQYKSSQILGERAAQRVDLVTKALLFRVASLAKDGNKFLIIDHLDHCSPLLYEVVRRELKVLQNMGLKILLTSRFPQYEEPVSRWCDSPDHNDDESLTIYWQCSNCEDDICETCKKEQTYCSKW